jgi:peptide/nickel transport system permease protein
VSAVGAQAAQPAPSEASSGRVAGRERARRLAIALLRSPTFVVGALVLLFWIVDALAWRLLAPHDPLALDAAAVLQGPSAGHPLGTDDLGRDVFSRVLAGAAPVLTVAPLATLLGLAGGTVVGLVSGYYRGLVDDVLSRVVDALLAFPAVVIALLALTVLRSSRPTVILVIGLLFIPIISRTVRGAVLVERQREYVASARAAGDSGPYVMFAEILPNIIGPIAVEGTVRLGYAIFTAATLSFLGVGLQIPSPDWGLTVAVERANLNSNAWVVLGPAVALATLVVAVNLVADGLRQVVEE